MMRRIRALVMLEPNSRATASEPEEWKKYRILYETFLVDPESLFYVAPLRRRHGTPFMNCKDLDFGVTVHFAKGGTYNVFDMTRADFLDAFPELDGTLPEVQHVHTL